MSKHIAIITLFPKMFSALCEEGITARAIKNELVTLHFINPREFTDDIHQTVDDRPYGGGPGMVMKFEPIAKAIQSAKNQCGEKSKVIYLSPQGKPLKQGLLPQFNNNNLILLCGRYEGIDERIIETLIDEEWSIGDYILSGGELAAMVLIDAITRLIPHALGHSDSAEQDSFNNNLLDHPHYTRPEEINGLCVPSILLSGDHSKIKRWRKQQSLIKTWQKRPDLIKRRVFTSEEESLLKESNIDIEELRHEQNHSSD